MNSDITRDNPTCFLFVVDQSHSMAQAFGERSDPAAPVLTKAEGVANALNDLLRNLIITCSKAEGVRNYFDVGVIGYGATVGAAWSGPLRGQYLVPIRDVASQFARMVSVPGSVASDGSSGPATMAPIWVEPVAGGSTPMCEALRLANSLLTGFIQRNHYCFPPVVVHITDGEATDGNPAGPMAALTQIASFNGPVMLFNVHLSSSRAAVPTSFPDSAAGLPDPFANALFEHASPLSPFMRAVAWSSGLALPDGARAFVLNADPSLMVLALEIGTRPGNVF